MGQRARAQVLRSVLAYVAAALESAKALAEHRG